MMFVSGETNDPPIETTSLIEDIVKGQVIEILLQSARTSHLRGSRTVLPEDVIFIIRHDKAKVNRLRTYLSWKDLRKNAKDQDATATLNQNNSNNTMINEDDDDGTGTGNNASGKDTKPSDKNTELMKVKKSTIKLPWELQFMFNEQPLENTDDNNDLDDDEREANITTLKRLKIADDRTKNMTKEEYVHWSDCRQASFTFRKSRRFKDWSGITQITEGKPHDDVIDILGFLTFEIVCALTETALRIKRTETILLNEKNKIKKDLNLEVTTLQQKRKKRLFDGPDDIIQPLKPKHIEEAWRILQKTDMKHRALTNFKGNRFSSRPTIL